MAAAVFPCHVILFFFYVDEAGGNGKRRWRQECSFSRGLSEMSLFPALSPPRQISGSWELEERNFSRSSLVPSLVAPPFPVGSGDVDETAKCFRTLVFFSLPFLSKLPLFFVPLPQYKAFVLFFLKYCFFSFVFERRGLFFFRWLLVRWGRFLVCAVV